MTTYGHRVSFGDDGNVLKWIVVIVCTTGNILKITDVIFSIFIF